MSSSGSHFRGPILARHDSQGGAAENMGIEVISGEADLVTVFDDFNDSMGPSGFSEAAAADGTTNLMEECGWQLTEDATVTAVADAISMNDPGVVADYFQSSLRIFPGTADDSGGNLQLDAINSVTNGVAQLGSGLVDNVVGGHRNFPHIWIPETGAGVTVLDNTIWTFACRIGLRADLTTSGAGAWDGKVFIGWAEAGETTIMTHTDGVLTSTGGPLVGFHIPEDGSIDGISKRVDAAAFVDGTNFTELHAAASVDGTVANGHTTAGDTSWWDLALRMDISDMSDDAANGTTTFYSRRVGVSGTAPGSRGAPNNNNSMQEWAKHPTIISNQTPNNAIALVPTIEVLNGPTAGTDCVVFLDWWSFGCSRYSRI